MDRGGLCEVCSRPGSCCKKVFLRGTSSYQGGAYSFEDPMSFETAEHLAMRVGLPFRPLEQNEQKTWTWTCLKLQPDGRCGDYDNRPELCQTYVAGSDGLCVHFHPPKGE